MISDDFAEEAQLAFLFMQQDIEKFDSFIDVPTKENVRKSPFDESSPVSDSYSAPNSSQPMISLKAPSPIKIKEKKIIPYEKPIPIDDDIVSDDKITFRVSTEKKSYFIPYSEVTVKKSSFIGTKSNLLNQIKLDKTYTLYRLDAYEVKEISNTNDLFRSKNLFETKQLTSKSNTYAALFCFILSGT